MKIQIETWYISGVHTGWRVVERGPRGYMNVISGHAFDWLIPLDHDRARREAERSLKVALAERRSTYSSDVGHA